MSLIFASVLKRWYSSFILKLHGYCKDAVCIDTLAYEILSVHVEVMLLLNLGVDFFRIFIRMEVTCMKIMNKLTLVLALAAGSLNAGRVKNNNKKRESVRKPTVVKATRKDSSSSSVVVKRSPAELAELINSVDFNFSSMRADDQRAFLSTLDLADFPVTEEALRNGATRAETFELLEAYLSTLHEIVSDAQSEIDGTEDLTSVTLVVPEEFEEVREIAPSSDGVSENSAALEARVFAQLQPLSEQVDPEYAAKLARITGVALELAKTSAALAAGYAVTAVAAPVAVMGAGLASGLQVAAITTSYAPYAVPVATAGAVVSAATYAYYEQLKASFNAMYAELMAVREAANIL